MLTTAQSHVLDHLREHFLPVTAQALADLHGLHVNTVREHLDVLVRRGLASRTRLSTQGRGRPSYGYLATPALSQLQAHAALVDALSDHLSATTEAPAVAAEALGRRYATRLPHQASPGQATGQELAPQAQIAAQMARLGFSPEPDPRDPTTMRLTTCPLLAAAHRHKDVVCGFHRGLAQGLLTAAPETGDESPMRITIDAFAEPGACLLTVTAASPADADENRTPPEPR